MTKSTKSTKSHKVQQKLWSPYVSLQPDQTSLYGEALGLWPLKTDQTALVQGTCHIVGFAPVQILILETSDSVGSQCCLMPLWG